MLILFSFVLGDARLSCLWIFRSEQYLDFLAGSSDESRLNQLCEQLPKHRAPCLLLSRLCFKEILFFEAVVMVHWARNPS